MKRRVLKRRTSRRKPRAVTGQIVKRLTAEGYTGDEVAQLTGMNKNSLRAKHALDLHAGRTEREEAQAAAQEMSKEERHLRDVIARAFNSHWQTPEGNLLFEGRDEEEAYQLAIRHPGNLWGVKV